MQRRKRVSKSRASPGQTQDTSGTQNDASQGNNQEVAGAGNVAANMETPTNANANTPAVASGGAQRHEAWPEEARRALVDEDEGHDANDKIEDDIEADGGSDAVWTPAREDKLIDLFRGCTFLYNKNTAGFLQRNKKDMAYTKIAMILGVTGKSFL